VRSRSEPSFDSNEQENVNGLQSWKRVGEMNFNLQPVAFACLAAISCGCTSSRPMLPKVPQERDPRMARIIIQRVHSIMGAGSPDFWVDWGSGNSSNALVLQNLSSGKRSTLEEIEKLASNIKRPKKTREWVPIHYASATDPSSAMATVRLVVDSTKDGIHTQVLVRDSSEHAAQRIVGRQLTLNVSGLHDFSISIDIDEIIKIDDLKGIEVKLPRNCAIVGLVGPGGSLVWDRPPGTLDLDILSPPMLVGTGVRIPVEAGQTYLIRYSPHGGGDPRNLEVVSGLDPGALK
jgi:hypothetical protein